jgi:hypothetical protein
MAGIERILKAARAATTEQAPDDAATLAVAPNVFELMTVKALKGGEARKPAKLAIWAGNGDWVGLLTCETEGLMMFVNCPTLAGLPAALESLITSPNPPWRTMSQWGAKKAKKKG